MKEKILFDARHIENEYSGLGRYTAYLLLGVLNRSELFEHLVIVLREQYRYEDNELYTLVEKQCNLASNVKIVYTGVPLYGLRHHLFTWITLSYYLDYTYFYPHFDVPLFARHRTIFVIHDLLPLVVDNYISKYKLVKRIFFKSMIRLNLRRKDVKCISVSRSTRDDIEAIFGISNVLHVVKSSDCLGRLNADSPARSSKEFPYLFYIGDRRPHKNLKEAIDLFREIKDRGYTGKFIIAGSAKNYNTDIEKYIAMSCDVIIVKNITNEQLLNYYRNMDALLFLSMYEGFGLPIVEAAKMKRKIIVHDSSAIPEVCPDWALVLDPILPVDIKAMMVLEYLDLETNYASFDSYRDSFSWENTAAEIF